MFGRRARLFFRLVLGQQIPQQSPDRRIVNGRGGAHEAERRSGALFTETEGVEPSAGGRRGNARMNSLNSDAVKPAASSNSGPGRVPISSEALYGGPTATQKSRGHQDPFQAQAHAAPRGRTGGRRSAPHVSPYERRILASPTRLCGLVGLRSSFVRLPRRPPDPRSGRKTSRQGPPGSRPLHTLASGYRKEAGQEPRVSRRLWS